MDLNDTASVKAAVEALSDTTLAGVVNNAGIMCRHYTLSSDGYETTLNVNYYNTMRFNNALLQQVTQGGALVFTTSITRIFVPRHINADSVNRHTFGQLKTYALSKKLITGYALELAPKSRESRHTRKLLRPWHCKFRHDYHAPLVRFFGRHLFQAIYPHCIQRRCSGHTGTALPSFGRLYRREDDDCQSY